MTSLKDGRKLEILTFQVEQLDPYFEKKVIQCLSCPAQFRDQRELFFHLKSHYEPESVQSEEVDEQDDRDDQDLNQEFNPAKLSTAKILEEEQGYTDDSDCQDFSQEDEPVKRSEAKMLDKIALCKKYLWLGVFEDEGKEVRNHSVMLTLESQCLPDSGRRC